MWHWNVRKNQGFTLIEMLATAIIIGIVAAISAPNLLGLLNRNRVNQGLVQLEGAIKEAQRQAIRNGKTCKIKLTTTMRYNDTPLTSSISVAFARKRYFSRSSSDRCSCCNISWQYTIF